MMHGTVCGNLGRAAEVKTVGSSQVTEFSVATDHYDNKEKKRVTTWVKVSAWGDRFAKLAPYLTKGTPVAVPGEITVREYTHNGEKRFSVECRASDVKLMGKREGESTDAPSHSNNDVGAEVPF